MKHNNLVVLGNGPSLRSFPLQELGNTPTLGMNAAYRYWRKINWYPQIYCCLDDQVVVSHQNAIVNLVESGKCKIFFLHPAILFDHPGLAHEANVYFLPSFLKGSHNEAIVERYSLPKYDSFYFKSILPGKITTGSYAVRFAAYLGYEHFYLIGVDCSYVELIPEAKKIDGITLEITKTPTHNPNYFFDDYQQEGDRYNIPNPTVHNGNLHLLAFEALKDDFAIYAPYTSIRLLTKKSALYVQNVYKYTNPENLINRSPEDSLDAVFISCTEREVPNLLQMLKDWTNTESSPYIIPPVKPSVALCIVFNKTWNIVIEQLVRSVIDGDSLLKKCFSSILFNYCDLSPEDDVYNKQQTGVKGRYSYVDGPNNMFFSIMQEFSRGNSHILLLETDCRPIKSNWLEIAESIVTCSDGFWVKGSYYRGVAQIKSLLHINGCAIYNVGNGEYQGFLSKIKAFFQKQSAINPMLSFDLLLWEYFSDVFNGTASDNLLNEWKGIYLRFQYSDFIQNLSAENDVKKGSTDDPYILRQEYPDAYFLHGKQFYGKEAAVGSTQFDRYDATVDQKQLLQKSRQLETDGIQFLQVVKSNHFTIEGTNAWHFKSTQGDEGVNFLSFAFKINSTQVFMNLSAHISLTASDDSEIEVSIARHQTGLYEGITHTLKLKAGMKKEFDFQGHLKKEYALVKLQISVLKPSTHSSMILCVNELDVVPVFTTKMEENKLHLISINPDMESEFGHYLHYDRKIKNVEKTCSIKLSSLGSNSLSKDIRSRFDWIFPSFYCKTYEKLIAVPEEKSDLKRLEEICKFLNNKATNDRKYIIYYYMVSYWNLPLYVEMMDNILMNPNVKAILNLSSIYFPSVDSLKKKSPAIESLINSSNNSSNIIITTDTSCIASLLKKICGIRLHVLPTFSVSGFVDGNRQKEHLDKVIYYPSNAQSAKGFELLEKCHAIASKSHQLDDWKFVFRWQLRDPKNESKFKNMRDRMSYAVSWVDGELSEDDYRQKFEQADVILLPYRLNHFRNRTSGQLIDALLTGKPVITARGSWAGQIVEKYQVGQVFEDGNAESMASALIDVICKIKLYRKNCLRYVEDYLQNSNEQAFIFKLKTISFESIEVRTLNPSLKIANELFRKGSYREALTQYLELLELLPNFKLYEDNVARTWQSLKRSGEDSALSLYEVDAVKKVMEKLERT